MDRFFKTKKWEARNKASDTLRFIIVFLVITFVLGALYLWAFMDLFELIWNFLGICIILYGIYIIALVRYSKLIKGRKKFNENACEYRVEHPSGRDVIRIYELDKSYTEINSCDVCNVIIHKDKKGKEDVGSLEFKDDKYDIVIIECRDGSGYLLSPVESSKEEVEEFIRVCNIKIDPNKER